MLDAVIHVSRDQIIREVIVWSKRFTDYPIYLVWDPEDERGEEAMREWRRILRTKFFDKELGAIPAIEVSEVLHTDPAAIYLMTHARKPYQQTAYSQWSVVIDPYACEAPPADVMHITMRGDCMEGGPHPRGTCYRHERTQLIYFYIPKNGCTTFRTRLAAGGGFEPYNYLWLEKPETHHRFVILRSPLDRFLSAYVDTLVAAPRFAGVVRYDRGEGLIHREEKDPLRRMRYILRELSKGNFFEERFVPQVEYLRDHKGQRFDIDRVLRLEDLDHEIPFLAKEYGFVWEGSFQRLNVSNPAKKRMAKELVQEGKLVSLIENIYREDLRLHEEA